MLPFLELDMMDICKENGAYDAKHFLCYYYYGGMIYTGLKNFERALYFYEQVIEREPQPHGQSFHPDGLGCNREFTLWLSFPLITRQ